MWSLYYGYTLKAINENNIKNKNLGSNAETSKIKIESHFTNQHSNFALIVL